MRVVLLTFFTLSSLIAVAQFHFPPTVNYSSSQDYGKKEKQNPEIYSIVQDNRGVMYFGTGNNVVEYDGWTWNVFKIQQGSYIWSMALDSNGVVYCGGTGQFGYLEPDSIGQMRYVSLADKLPMEEMSFGIFWEIFSNEEQVFFQSEDAIYAYNYHTKELVAHFPEGFDDTYHTSFMIDQELYIRQRTRGIVKFDDGKFTKLPGTELFEVYGLFGMHKLDDDSLLLITQEVGLYKYKDGNMRQLPELNEKPTSALGIYGSQTLADGTIGLRTVTEGLVIIDEEGRVLRQIDHNSGIRSNDIKRIYQDRDLNVWLGMANGIARLNYMSPISHYNEKTGCDGDVQTISRFKGNLYVGTSFGLFVQNREAGSNKLFLNTGAFRGQVWDMTIIDDALYVATGKGVLKSVDGVNFSQVNKVEGTNAIIEVPSRNYIVTAGKSGIQVWDKSFNEVWQHVEDFPSVIGIEVDPVYTNKVWIGTASHGVWRLTIGEGWEFSLDQYGYMEGLNDDNLGKPIIVDGQLRFGSSQGVLTFISEEEMLLDIHDSLKDNPDNYRGMFQFESLHDSLFEDQILLIEAGEDVTWYCHENQLGYFNKDRRQFIYKPFKGIDHGRFNEFYLEEDGVLWIGTSDGLIRYEENPHKIYEHSFRTLIRKVILDRDSVIFGGAWVDKEGLPITEQKDHHIFEIPYDHNDITFFFSAPFFEDDHDIYFSYKLEGDDDRWSKWSLKNEANFTNLAEGDYVFQVKAKNIFDHESIIAEYHFTVLPPWYRTTWAYILYGLAFLLVLYLGVRISSARLKAKNAWLEGVVEERTQEIREKNVVLRHQKEEIEDSINYAQRIQEAILPLQAEMKRWIPKSFVLFRPKDVVSGDFYWFQEKDNKLVFVCADCTGHGVPGAFMSMLGSNGLNNIVMERGITAPGEILANLNRAIKKNLKQDGRQGSTKDGMDAAICTIDLDKKVVTYSGAMRPLWIVKGGEIEEIKATKVAVAGFTPDDQIFEDHEFPMDQGWKFYMTSDGYADQFGGEREKKYKVKNMKNFILQICGKPFDEQSQLLEDELIEWMGNIEQIDDVCVVGFET